MIECDIPIRASAYTMHKMAALGITGDIHSPSLEFICSNISKLIFHQKAEELYFCGIQSCAMYINSISLKMAE